MFRPQRGVAARMRGAGGGRPAIPKPACRRTRRRGRRPAYLPAAARSAAELAGAEPAPPQQPAHVAPALRRGRRRLAGKLVDRAVDHHAGRH